MAAQGKKVAVVAIVQDNSDEPVYLKDLRNVQSEEGNNADEYLLQFIIHSSLDMVSEKQWQTPNLFLGVVETFREYSVSAFVSVSGARILLLHRGQTETAIKSFLKGVHSLWVKAAMNPLHRREERITGPGFDSRVINLAQKVFGGNVM